MIRVLFLDMDGVVLSGDDLAATGNRRHIPIDKINLVNAVCSKAGAVVVLSSTWRHFNDARKMIAATGVPFHADWRTPLAREMVGSIITGQQRGAEIAQWLKVHPEVSSYAIVDDDSDMLPSQYSRFVQTLFATGINQTHADRLVEILNTPLERH